MVGMLEAFTLFVLYVIELLIATKSDAISRYLKFLLDSFLYHWGHFLCYMSPNCLFNIQSKLVWLILKVNIG